MCVSACVCVCAAVSGARVKIYVLTVLLPVDTGLAPLCMTCVCSNVTQFMVRVGAEQYCDTEQLRTPELGSLPGVLHGGRQPERRGAECVGLWIPTYAWHTRTHRLTRTRARAHTHIRARERCFVFNRYFISFM